MKIIDTHCHLDDEEFNEDLPSVLQRAKEAGIIYILTAATEPQFFQKVVNIAQNYEQVYFFIGVHPHDAKKAKEKTFLEVEKLLHHPKCIGIGEVGLDYHYNLSSPDIQKKVLKRLADIAYDYKKPLSVHVRESENDIIEILGRKDYKIILHSYNGSKYLLDWAKERDCYFSISGMITFKNAKDLRESVIKIPLDKLFVETDAPYLAPVPMRGKRNEPAFTRYTLKALSDVLDIGEEELSRTIYNNTVSLFELP
ncbi:MAG: TatD family hydrolase [Deltaproteobacteria bacterium]|nr:TatD family hydrolase [Deltaproteobacteria bacterium]